MCVCVCVCVCVRMSECVAALSMNQVCLSDTRRRLCVRQEHQNSPDALFESDVYLNTLEKRFSRHGVFDMKKAVHGVTMAAW